MIEHAIEHEIERLSEPLNFFPCSKRGIDGKPVDDSEAIIGRGRIKWEQMDAAHEASKVSIDKIGQRSKRSHPGFFDLVCISNEQGVSLRERQGFPFCGRLFFAMLSHQFQHARIKLLCRAFAIEKLKMSFDARHVVSVYAKGGFRAINDSGTRNLFRRNVRTPAA